MGPEFSHEAIMCFVHHRLSHVFILRGYIIIHLIKFFSVFWCLYGWHKHSTFRKLLFLKFIILFHLLSKAVSTRVAKFDEIQNIWWFWKGPWALLRRSLALLVMEVHLRRRNAPHLWSLEVLIRSMCIYRAVGVLLWSFTVQETRFSCSHIAILEVF